MLSKIKVKDWGFGWTPLHAFFAGALDGQAYQKKHFKKVIYCILSNRELNQMMLKKDKDGYIPLMSALKRNISGKLFKLTYESFPEEMRKEMLSSRNTDKASLLQFAFRKRLWGPVKIMVTDIFYLYGAVDTKHALIAEAVSLLDEAVSQGYTSYFNIFLNACEDKLGRENAHELMKNLFQQKTTIWKSLANQTTTVIKRILKHIEDFGGIYINTLYTDSQTKT